MPTFGFSAFLKLLSLNDRPSRTQLRVRLSAEGGGYDFHRSLRRRAARLVEGTPLAEIEATLDEITRAPERRSAAHGLQQLGAWLLANPGDIVPVAPATFESPAGLYKVTYAPDFGVRMGSDTVAVHLWNTAHPELSTRMVYAALSLYPNLYAEGGAAPDDLAVLSLPDLRLYRLSEAGRYAGLGPSVAARFEEVLREVQDSIDRRGGSDRPGGGPRRP